MRVSVKVDKHKLKKTKSPAKEFAYLFVGFFIFIFYKSFFAVGESASGGLALGFISGGSIFSGRLTFFDKVKNLFSTFSNQSEVSTDIGGLIF